MEEQMAEIKAIIPSCSRSAEGWKEAGGSDARIKTTSQESEPLKPAHHYVKYLLLQSHSLVQESYCK